MRLILLIIFASWANYLVGQSSIYAVIDSLKHVVDTIPATDKRKLAMAQHELATSYMHTTNYVEAARYYAESLKLATELQDELLMALIYRNMGVLSFNQMNYDKTTEYHKKALAIYEKRNDNIRKAELLRLMADNMYTNSDSLNARRYYEEAIAIFKQTGNKLGEAMAYCNYSLVYYTRYPEKIRIAMDAKKIFDSLTTDNPMPAINTGNIGVAYFDIVRYNHQHLAPPGPFIPATRAELLVLAEKYFREAISIAQSKHDVDDAAYFSGLLAELQEFNGDYRNAYYNIRKYFETNDSIYSQGNKNQIAALQNKQELDLKNAEIETRKLQVRNQRTQMLLLAGGLTFLLVIGILLYRQGRIRKKNNQQLQELNKKLAAANQVKAKFFAILSHDLRSPIARLVSFLQYRKLKPGAFSESQVIQHEGKIEESAQDLLETMEGTLLWSKQQMDNFEPVKTEVKVQSLFDQVRKSFLGNDYLQFGIEGDPGLTLITDENYLKTILHNLTSNAIKAVGSTSSPSIEWRAWREEGFILLSIQDNGPGIPAEMAANFFGGITQTDSRHGLGLYIIHDLANAIGCQLSLGKTDRGLKVILSFSV